MDTDEWATPTALVVDDDATILELIAEVVREAGYTPTCSTRGQPAFATLAQQRFDLLLIDLWLPDLNGLELCQAARRLYGDYPAVLLLTADHRLDRWITTLDLGVDACVGKPFEVDVLRAQIVAKPRCGQGHVNSGSGRARSDDASEARGTVASPA